MTKARSLSDFIESDGSVTLVDNQQIKVGTGNDLQIFHNATDSIIFNQTGALMLRGNDVRIQSMDASATLATLTNTGAVTLYHNNSVKLATTSTGVSVTGNIANASGDMTIDVAGDISLDADGAQIRLKDGGTQFGLFGNESSDFLIQSSVQDKDIIFQGNDGGVGVTALTLDMSNNGKALFGQDIGLGDNGTAFFGASGDLKIFHDGANSYIQNLTNSLIIQSETTDRHVIIKSDDGSGGVVDYFRAKGDTGAAILYHYGSEKLATTSTGVSVTGDIAVTGNVDGRDVSTDGTKLDTIDTNANYITNNNQLTNGAGYVTSSGNTIIGTDSDIDTSGATVVDQLNMTDGVIQSHSTRTMTLADLGYTGATNANYITNNNQLSNGAGYTTYSANQSLNTTNNPTFNQIYANDWFRANGNTGIYWQTHGRGWQMSDSSWIRTYGAVGLYVTNGQILATSNITAYYSDERLKDKVGKIENALDKVSQIETFYFKENELAKSFGHDIDKVQVGVSAQSVEKVLPEIVDLAPFDMNDEMNGSKSGEDYMTVDYAKLTPLLIEAIKELKAEIKELKESK